MADFLGKTVTAVIVVIGVVILMSAAAVLLPVLNAAGLNSSDLCTDNGCFYNASRTNDCSSVNTTPADTSGCTNAGAEMPLSGLFNTTGLMPLVFGASILVLSVVFLVLLIRKKAGK